MPIRLIVPTDAASYQALRLRALREHPEAFLASYDEEADTPIEEIAQRLASTPPDILHFGAWHDEALIGMLVLLRPKRIKARHKASLGGMYVVPEERRSGVGRQLLEHVLSHAQTLSGLEALTLAVTVGNEAARQLYLKAGFVPYGIEPRFIRVGPDYHDVEWMYQSLTTHPVERKDEIEP
ncbi:MAG: GNAT family N-acetyltransferase [Anaerolineae bacterium]|nr:GNAT family N-acetyltransferase [Anaerolineae bacterium]